MSGPLLSAHWYRVAHLQPRLRPQVQVQRHSSRAQRWHQLSDAASGRRHRINQDAWHFVGCFDGRVTVGQAWDAVLARHQDQALTQDQAIRVLEQLSSAELLQCELPPDIHAQFRQKQTRQTRQRWLAMNPLAIRLRLFDPSRWLDRCAPALPHLFSRMMLLAWLAAILPALLMIPHYWPELKAFALTHAGTPRSLAIAWLAYPLIKGLHEAGHALAVRRWGGAVREVGVTMFLLMPVPYVDASAASGFTQRSRRAVVSAVGIMVEVLLAALAFYVWTEVQPGLVRDIAFVTLLTAGLSTLAVNANPLLRFDGYFLLCDLAGLPNLDQRSRAWWSGFLQRRVAGADITPMALAPGERKWLVLYAPLALAYRLGLGIQTMLWGAGKSALLALLLAAALAAALLTGPLRSAGGIVLQVLRNGSRPRARLAMLLAGAGLVLAFAALPLPFGASVSAVVWLPEQAQLRAGTAGVIRELPARDGMIVGPGQVLAVLEDPDLDAGRAEAASRLAALLAEQYSLLRNSRAQALGLEQAIAHAQAELARFDEKIAGLVIRSGAAGRLALQRQDDLPGAYLKKGALLGHVLPAGDATVRALVPHADAALVRERSRAVSVWLADQAAAVPARLLRDVPAATQTLPSAALSDRNGGPLATDPADKDNLRALESYFLFDVALPGAAVERAGARAQVHFDFGNAPLAFQWAHALRQLAVRQFGGDG
ncbi:MAG: biotin/lipoyl-binding protein [Noviherbaspirillum sp.]